MPVSPYRRPPVDDKKIINLGGEVKLKKSVNRAFYFLRFYQNKNRLNPAGRAKDTTL